MKPSPFGLLAALAFVTVCGKGSVVAQEKLSQVPDAWLGTISVNFEPYMSGGSLSGCELVYAALVRDDKYDVGTHLKIWGHIGMLSVAGNATVSLKLIARKFRISSGQFSETPSPPTRAFLISKDYSTTASVKSTTAKAEDAGGILVLLEPAAAMKFLTEMTLDEQIGIGFNQESGDSDLTTTLDLTVKDMRGDGSRVHSPAAVTEFANCISALAQTFEH